MINKSYNMEEDYVVKTATIPTTPVASVIETAAMTVESKGALVTVTAEELAG
jgi:hypothetical protein